ncbi:MAG TPA: hypothetical protein VGC38_03260 [Pseudolabrys sp.]
MLRTITAIMSAAAVAAVVTAFTGPSPVDAGPKAKPVETAMRLCVNQPWPYLHCVGTQFGNPKVRLVSVERLN